MSNSFWLHGRQHARLHCPSLSPRGCSDLCPLSHWCYLTSSSSAAPFFFCLQSFPASRVFSSESALCIRWPKYWRFSFSISPSNEYSGLISFRIDWFDSNPRDSQESSPTPWFERKHQFFSVQPSLWSNSHIRAWLLEKPQLWLYRHLSAKWYLCLFNTLPRFVIAFLPRSKGLVISWLQSPSVVTLEP